MVRHGLVAMFVLASVVSAFGASREQRVRSNFEALYPSAISERTSVPPAGGMPIPSSPTAVSVSLHVSGGMVFGSIGSDSVSWFMSGSTITGSYHGGSVYLYVSGSSVYGRVGFESVSWTMTGSTIMGTMYIR